MAKKSNRIPRRRHRKTFTVRLATFNLLGWHHSEPGGKNAGMRDGVWRAGQTVALFLAMRLAVVVMQETEAPQRRVIHRSKVFNVRSAEWNSRLPRNNTMTNAMAVNRLLVKVTDFESVRMPVWSGGHPNGLNITVALLTLRSNPLAQWVMVGVHNPSKGAVSGGSDEERQQCITRQAKIAVACADRGLPVVVAGDANDPGAAADMKRAIERVGRDVEHGPVRIVAQRGVDIIVGVDVVEKSTDVRTNVNGVLSDHPLVAATVEMPLMVAPVARLPRQQMPHVATRVGR